MRSIVLAFMITGLSLAVSADAQEKKTQEKKALIKKVAASPPPKREATPPGDLTTLPGFKVELVHTANPAEEGSWISMCKDSKGRLIIAGQRNHPVLRFTLTNGKVTREEKLALPISEVMGLLDAFDSLYVNGAGPDGFGLYRCKETSDSGTFTIQFLKRFEGAGEHGPHGMAVGPDNKIYIVNGNHTKLPEGLAPNSPHRNYREDHLLPRQWDGNGHATGILAPGGYVVRTDAEGKSWELYNAGFRNAYDIAFNGDGELFTFDSDMEWDWGMPWYRPTRVNHIVSGAEFGWRSGTGKWPAYYPDSLPATVDIGIGSPTGVSNGHGARFPAKYQKAIYICDWTYGRLIAVHLTPSGSSYKATFENFVAPKGLDGVSPKKPLNLTDVVVGDDGAMYFTVGGRNTQGALYRVSYTGTESTAPADLTTKTGAELRKQRQQLEQFQSKEASSSELKTILEALNHTDRHISYAARVALENQPIGNWRSQLDRTDLSPRALTLISLAIARVGEQKDQAAMLSRLIASFKIAADPIKLQMLRVIGVSCSRHGMPPGTLARKIMEEVDAIFPGKDERINREASQVLIYLQSPRVLAKCLKLLADARTVEDRNHYLFHLRTLSFGFWTPEQRKEYLSYYTRERDKSAHPKQLLTWFEQTARPYSDGASFNNFYKNFLKEFVANLSASEWKELQPAIAAIDKAAAVAVEPRPREFVKKWTTEELLPQLSHASSGRNFEKGKQAYIDAQCAKCHRFGDFGGSVGPDLTAIASRFTRRDILESMLEPSKVISEQYQNEQIETASGQTIIGRVVDETAISLSLQPDPLDAKRIVVKKFDIESRKPAKLSPMPANLVDVLTGEEILDLLAFMESAGRRQHPAFQKR